MRFPPGGVQPYAVAQLCVTCTSVCAMSGKTYRFVPGTRFGTEMSARQSVRCLLITARTKKQQKCIVELQLQLADVDRLPCDSHGLAPAVRSGVCLGLPPRAQPFGG